MLFIWIYIYCNTSEIVIVCGRHHRDLWPSLYRLTVDTVYMNHLMMVAEYLGWDDFLYYHFHAIQAAVNLSFSIFLRSICDILYYILFFCILIFNNFILYVLVKLVRLSLVFIKGNLT